MVLIFVFFPSWTAFCPIAHNNSTASLNSQRSISKTNNSHYDSIAGATAAAANQNTSMTTSGSNGGPGAGLYENGSSVMRKSPEGKDNDDAYRGENNVKALSKDSSLMQPQKYHETTNKLNDHHHNHHQQQQQPQQPHQRIGNDISTEIFSASNDNGKINVQVTVLVGEFFLSFPFSSVHVMNLSL